MISWRGNCIDCGHARCEQAIVEQHEHRGPMYRRWQRALLAGVLGVPLDEVPAIPQTGERA